MSAKKPAKKPARGPSSRAIEFGAAKMGRPTKLTPVLQDQLCNLLEQGWFVEHACAEVGISDTTFDRWMSEGTGEDAPSEKADFRASCTRSRARGQRIFLDRIIGEGQTGDAPMDLGDWKRHAWRLERMSALFRVRTSTEITGAAGAPLLGPTIMLPPETED